MTLPMMNRERTFLVRKLVLQTIRSKIKKENILNEKYASPKNKSWSVKKHGFFMGLLGFPCPTHRF
jgi:hypothetical protein